MTSDDFNNWIAQMGWDHHGGRKLAAKALGVTPETIRKLSQDLSPYSKRLELAMEFCLLHQGKTPDEIIQASEDTLTRWRRN